MATKEDWTRELDNLRIQCRPGVSIHFPAPKRSWAWYVGAEKGHEFKTIVVQWTGKGKDPELRDRLRDYEHEKCKGTDVRKGWLYRLWIEPKQLEGVLGVLGEVGKSGPWPVTGKPREMDHRTTPPVHALDSEESGVNMLVERWPEIPECSQWVNPEREVRTSRGLIDVLARGRFERALLVIEAKRSGANEGVLRQLREYMGAVKLEIDPDARILGWIVAESASPELRALCASQADVKFFRWHDLLP